MELQKKKVSEMPLLGSITPESIIMVVDGDTNYKYALENITQGGVESVTSTDNHIVINNTDPKKPTVSFQLANNENLITDEELAELQANIDAETQARIAADDILQANIDAIDVVETNELIPVTYEELKTLKDASQLIPLQTYLLTDYRTTYQMSTDYQLDYNGDYYQTLEPMGGIVGEISNVSNQDGTVRTITLISGGSNYEDGTYVLDGGNYECYCNVVTNNGVITSVSLVGGGNMYNDGEYSISGGDNDAIVRVSVGYKTYQVAGNTNPLEPLIITAAGTNSLETICKSTVYGQDIIYYNIDDNSEGFTKGKIYRRIDTIQNNDIGTDWRHIKYRRWKLNVTDNWVNGQAYNIGDIVKNGTSIYICYKVAEI